MDRSSSSELSRGNNEAGYRAGFEETYPRYEFAELVRLALAIGAWLVNARRRIAPGGPDMPGGPLPGEAISRSSEATAKNLLPVGAARYRRTG